MIVGIDPSLACTGVVTSDQWHEVKSKPSGQDVRGRVARYRDLASRIIRHVPGYADIVVIETYSFGSQSRAQHVTQEFGGILRDRLDSHVGCDIVEIAPATLKIFFTDKGNATKEDMATNAHDRYGVGECWLSHDNLIDAYALYRIGMLMWLGTDECIDLMEFQGFEHVLNPAARKARDRKKQNKKRK